MYVEALLCVWTENTARGEPSAVYLPQDTHLTVAFLYTQAKMVF